MKKYIFIAIFITIVVSIFAFRGAMKAQDNNLVINGSFENISNLPYGPGDNYMGNQISEGGNNYAGIIAYYGDEAGILKTVPGYQRYSEYIQLELNLALTAGKSYLINFNASLAEKSAYAVSGLGVYFSNEKLDVKNNTFLDVTPHLVACEIVKKTEWQTISGKYVAKGDEKYLTIGCFKACMDTVKVIHKYTNNSREAYYYIDEVKVNSENSANAEDFSSILYGDCFMLQELNFEPNKSNILPMSYEELKELAHFLKTYPFLVVYIDGHTDMVDTEEHNEQLSEERALEVKKYLVAYGVKEDHLKTRGFGSTNPIDPSNEKSLKNERVEITICVAD